MPPEVQSHPHDLLRFPSSAYPRVRRPSKGQLSGGSCSERLLPLLSVKWLLESPDNAQALLAVVAPDLAGVLDFSRARLMPTEQISDSLRKQEADLIFSVPFLRKRRGAPAEVRIYLLIEHQSKPDPLIILRVFLYMFGLWDQQYRQWRERYSGSRSGGERTRRQRPDFTGSKSGLRLLPVIPLIFYTGTQKWERPQSLTELMDLPDELKRFVPRSEVLFLNLKETSAEALVAGDYPLGWLLMVMQVVDLPKEQLEATMEEALEHLGGLPDEQREVLGKLLWFLTMMLYFRREPEEAQELAERVDAVARKAKVEEMGQTLWQELIEQGRREGIERGRQEGRQEGLEQGIERGLQEGRREGHQEGRKEGVEALREAALDALTTRFGSLPPEVMERVRAIEDTAPLKRLIHLAFSAASLGSLTF